MNSDAKLRYNNATKGRVVFTLAGKEVKEGTPDSKARINGPHTESKWAQHLLGTEETAGERKRRLTLARERQYEITPPKAPIKKRPMSKLAAALVIGTMLGVNLR
jgi:hypothetical protein